MIQRTIFILATAIIIGWLSFLSILTGNRGYALWAILIMIIFAWILLRRRPKSKRKTP